MSIIACVLLLLHREDYMNLKNYLPFLGIKQKDLSIPVTMTPSEKSLKQSPYPSLPSEIYTHID